MRTTFKVDLRSDTVTKPSPEMIRFMTGAALGDDVYDEDPTVHELQELVAGLLGHEAGLFTPTGSMANLIAVRCHVQPGQEVLCDSSAHIVRAELGAHASLGGVTTRTWPMHSAGQLPGQLKAADVLDYVADKTSPYLVGTACVAVENTHNFAGGTIQDINELRLLKESLTGRQVAVHLDGARLWNAVASGAASLEDFGQTADSVQVCLSKGLGAPVGSVLVGSKSFIDQARVWRKRFGGGMRQIGLLAAAGIFAVKNHRAELVRDHAAAMGLAMRCNEVLPGSVDLGRVQTNMVMVRVPAADEVVRQCADVGLGAWALDSRTVRLVTHRDLSKEAIEWASDVLATTLTSLFSAEKCPESGR